MRHVTLSLRARPIDQRWPAPNGSARARCWAAARARGRRRREGGVGRAAAAELRATRTRSADRHRSAGYASSFAFTVRETVAMGRHATSRASRARPGRSTGDRRGDGARAIFRSRRAAGDETVGRRAPARAHRAQPGDGSGDDPARRTDRESRYRARARRADVVPHAGRRGPRRSRWRCTT